MEKQKFTEDIAQFYIEDNKRRAFLSDLTGRVQSRLGELDLNLDEKDAEQLKAQISSDTFKILIIGEFNTGKSTFINALLGHEVLPSKAIPATAIINQVRYGENPAAKLHFKDHNKEAIDVPIERLNEYVLIKSAEENAARDEIRESPFSHAEIWWPLELCKDNNVEIIDSPGLNESKVREEVTYDYLRKVDAVLFLMAAVRFGPAQSEMDTIKMLDAAGHKDLFFIINQWDLLRLGRDRDEVRGRAMSVLTELTSRKKDIFFVSALDALEGRVNKDKSLENKSGFHPLESSLHKFLAIERSKIKSLRGGRELLIIIRKLLHESIPTKVRLLKTPLGDLKTRYDNAKIKLGQLKTEKNNLIDYLTRESNQLTSMVSIQVEAFFSRIDMKIDTWCNEVEISIVILSEDSIKQQVSNATNDLSAHLTKKLETAFKEWEKKELTPFIDSRMDNMMEGLDIRAKDFERKLGDIQFELSGATFKNIDIPDEFGPKNALERILAAAGGWFLGGLGGGALGAVFGYREMLKAALPNLAAMITAMVIGLPLLPVMAIVSVIMGFKIVGDTANKLRKVAAEEFKKSLREKSSLQAADIANQLDVKLRELKDALEAGMERQIAQVSEQTEAALKEHNKGAKEVAQKIARIESITIEITQIEASLNQFLQELENKN